ncbi:4-hydroxybenzoate polyprenyltransferase [Catalinimonas alkaloidigena]|uniref:UbiA family prenyltransferase n=1 Tax=Catalinimonas alkaloidigena TaxID=1075417 RepID=UPI0024073743|nr:UbiA family prenyltransferase [Catalinimonas alkaloidigena]MDF9800523.1 4-hydroxybenzoate polyprenyltransferase [Catalinimonas alkaloidigena]
MITKSTLLHLRLPFSVFLLPIFLFALSVDVPEDWPRTFLVFFIIHFLLYPASNGYNSYFDKDEGSIGGLEKPPLVSKDLYWVALLLDLLAILLGLLINWQFALMLLIYGLVSKAYSHPSVRLKKHATASWFIAGFFQGCFTWLMAYMSIHDVEINEVWVLQYVLPALLSSLMLWGSYPMTQIYQHEEDVRRGDITLSYKLGVIGTFHFTAIVFAFSAIGFFLYYRYFFSLTQAFIYLIFLLPIISYFFYWYWQVRHEKSEVNYKSTMRLNMISGLSLNVFFLLMLLWAL